MKISAPLDDVGGLTVVAVLSTFAILAALQACGGAMMGDGRDDDDLRSSEPCNTRTGQGCTGYGSSGYPPPYGGRGGGGGYRR